MAYSFKVYIKDGREYFEYGEESRKTIKRDFELAQSLLDLLYLDVRAYGELIDRMGKAIQALYPPAEERQDESKNISFIREGLGTLAKAHIYFELLSLDWNERLDRYAAGDYRSRTGLLPYKEISHIPSEIQTMQEQIKKLFSEVLDIMLADKGMTVQQRMVNYYRREASSLERFTFQPQMTSFEAVDDDTFTEVFYPKNIYDLVQFFLRACVQQETPVRVCKSCGKYFAVTGYSNSEYCNREFKDSGKTCKEVGAVRVLQTKLSTDPVHKAYSKAYKTRFARIRYRKITKEQFSLWSELAREMRDRCLAGEIPLEEFQRWLDETL